MGILIVVAILGIIRGKEILIMIETAVALAVAAIPEGLPIVATVAMARGMIRMADRNALVNRLAAVETLGGTNIIFTDKTGTLTENRMTVNRIILKKGQIIVKEESKENDAYFYKNDHPIGPAEKVSEEERKMFLESSIFARVSPEQKLDLVNIYQQTGSVVAMTGDGVNDAPGLRKADIGIAMGQRGTQVAREASDMVLKDDSFATIIEAIKQGRIIFNNIRKFIVYLLSGNASEIMIVLIASVFNTPLPILPLQILLLNIISDVFPALALGLGEGTDDVMKYPPRDPREPVLTHVHWLAVFGYGLLIAASVLTAFTLAYVWLELENAQAVTTAFLTLAFARLWHIFNMRDTETDLIKNEVVGNKFVWAAIILCTIFLLSVIYLPVVSSVLKLVVPNFKQWTLIIAMSLMPLVLGQLFKYGKNMMFSKT